ncbi:MAG: DUF4352 domain-containing protein [Chloroflexota bacterium]
MSESYQPQEPSWTSPEPRRSGFPGWATALIVGGVCFVCLCAGLSIVGIGALSVLGTQTSDVFSEIESGLAELPTLEPFDTSGAVALGDTAVLRDLHITVIDATSFRHANGTLGPDVGNEYWSVEVVFENVSDEVIQLGIFTGTMQDADENVYEYSFLAEDAASDIPLDVVQPLRPGETATGYLFYEVPEDASALFWIYDSFLSGEQAVIQVK